MVSKEAFKLKEKARSIETAEELGSQGLVVVDKELYERQKRKELAIAIIFVVEVIALLFLVYFAGRKDALVSCVDMLVSTNGLATDYAKVVCKTVVGW